MSDGAASSDGPSQELLAKLVDACLLQRLSADKWEHSLRELLLRTPGKVSLSNVFLDEKRFQESLVDPLYPSYLVKALNMHLLHPFDILKTLTKTVPELQNLKKGVAQYPLLRVITETVPNWRPSRTSWADTELLWSLVRLVHKFTNTEPFMRDQILFIETIQIWIHIIGSQHLRPLFKKEKENNTGILHETTADTDAWKSFDNEYHNICNAVATKLPFSRIRELDVITNEFRMDLASVKSPVEDTAPEPPKISLLQTRATLPILLIALREAMGLGKTDELWRMIDRTADNATGREIFQSLILAGFDALSIVLKRSDMTTGIFQDPVSEIALYQSLIVNRIPALLSTRKDQYGIPSEDIEMLLLDLFPTPDPVLLSLNVPSLDNLNGPNSETLGLPAKDYRQDFMCALIKFGFLDVDAPMRLLGIETEEISPLADVKDITDEANDFMDEEGAIQRIIEKLGRLDGNQSVIVAAIVELVQTWCSSHNLHLLSVLCSGLMRDTTLIDQLFLHTSLPSLIEPIREFLDGWTIDEEDDNGESQVIYAQFNSVLFFICYCVQHFGREICLQDPNGPGFIRTWIREFSKPKWLDMLSDEDSNAIGLWISALFDGDGISGISDDLVSPPYKWLRISTTLFQQCVNAYRQGVLQLKTLQDGFEHFMHPFLEPCLLGAIHYLTTQMKTSTPETITPYVEILSSLLSILSPSTEEEDPFLTDTFEPKQSRVLQILSPTIINTISFLTLDQATPVKHLIDPILESLRPYSNYFRPSPPKTRKALLLAMRTTQTRLAQWSLAWNEGFAVPTGVDLRVVGAAVKHCGASVVIRNIVAEALNADVAYAFHTVAVAGMFLTIPFDVGFGMENLAERYLFMTPGEEKEMGMGRSLDSLTDVVKRLIGWTDTKARGMKAEQDAMVVDS